MTAEAMVAIPVVVLLLLLAVAAGRVTIALGTVEAAARDAAREASIARTPWAAKHAAVASAQASLRSGGLHCADAAVQVDTAGFARAAGSPANVGATVSCRITLSDLGFPGMAASVTKRAHSISPLDPYRGRG
ncbi:TadE/TadG family type IV pilus assembly protein [Actinomadura rupiterrae]|uniref:TadE/TadG family type IV pilus assembly protein n=1 Tax=Actinomadura rupiterrae TaxID=559627 RepID=UPI0020A4142B|nr:TadE/TadG family type IV pilus assembly protein [Actinomadura rupiterrae]MCP2337510.1 Flp pilus assembly protein TadG [Actinomadura rupiterrae]